MTIHRRVPRRLPRRLLVAAVACAVVGVAPQATAVAAPDDAQGGTSTTSSTTDGTSGTTTTGTAGTDTTLNDNAAAAVDRRGPGQRAGAVHANRDLPARRLVAGAASGSLFTYWSSAADASPHLSTGTLFVPKGTPPAGGWPIVAWAHGSRGLADRCAPSVRPVSEDTDQIREWLSRKYAVVTTDYAGLGTPGTPQYFDIKATAKNIVDAVRAGRDVGDRLSRSWVAVGRSQGASAAIELARSAPSLQGSTLDFKGSAVSSIPASLDTVMTNLGPTSTALPAAISSDVLYTLTAIRNARPDLKVADLLTDTGKSWLGKAASTCADDLTRQVAGLRIGSLFRTPIAENRALAGELGSALALPTTGFTRPLLLAQSIHDDGVVVPMTLKYLNDAQLGDRKVTARTYLTLTAQQSNALADQETRTFVSKSLGR
ncbi:lipase family protein [Gordonia soli]|uniref:Lipase n=1 Tax=Gordonia soli NBRC 108243 TaxID=1223545 RepID=M0QGD5_9ACTN|nr:lipase family protein [Gordonia soli]GAC66452.1 hypothetical protein GS4_02_01630 [Gordonia soli NBRC 108243]